MCRLAMRMWAAALMIAAITGALPARAQDERVTLRVDGRPVFRVGAMGETDAATRARQIERRMATLLENPEAITAARIEQAGANGAGRVYVWGIGSFELTEGVDALATWCKGALRFRLEGARLKGEWRLFNMKGRQEKGRPL